MNHLSFSIHTAPVDNMIKEVDVDGDGRIDFFEFARVLGEPDNNSDDDYDDDDDEDDDDEANQQTHMKMSTVRTIITSPIDSPRASVSTDDIQPSTSSVNRPTARQMEPAKGKPASRPYRSVSPNPKSAPRRLSNPFYERLRSPSLKESLLTSSTQMLSSPMAIPHERRPSRISDEVARLSEVSFRESYNAIAKPDTAKSPYALDFSSLDALRESYKTLVELTNGDADDAEGSETADSSRRCSTANTEYQRKRSLIRHETMASFDIVDVAEDDTDTGGSAPPNDADPGTFVLAYEAVPGFVSGAFYMARESLQWTQKKKYYPNSIYIFIQ